MTETDLIVVDSLNAKAVFAPGGVEKLLADIEAKARAVKTDISTEDGRSAVASLAYKVARSKTTLDEMGKNLVADLKRTTGLVDAERRTIRDRLDALKDEVRQPLTDWENADKNRITEHEDMIAEIEAAVVFSAAEPDSIMVQARIGWLADYAHNRDWEEFSRRAAEARERVGAALAAQLATIQKRDAEREELERLRRERTEQERKEREQKIAVEAADKARREAEAKAAADALAVAETARKEQERVENEKKIAEERARKAEADRVAAVAKAEADKKAAAEAAERAKTAAVEAERKRVADAQAAEAAETAKREADKKHRAKINNEVLGALRAYGAGPELAKAIIGAIARGEVPHVSISY